ncbi:hypothetical protein, partial [Billgrantia endophytica]
DLLSRSSYLFTLECAKARAVIRGAGPIDLLSRSSFDPHKPIGPAYICLDGAPRYDARQAATPSIENHSEIAFGKPAFSEIKPA